MPPPMPRPAAFPANLASSAVLVFLLLAVPLSAPAREPPAAAIATTHPLATAAGFDILEAGGNAFDAAVAVSAVLAVVEPASSGLGGGGFWLLHRARDGHQVMIDGRERAPLAAARDMYLDENGEVIEGLTIDGPRAAAIPGEPAALVHLASGYGRLPLKATLAAAISHARNGFAVDEHYRDVARFRLETLRRDREAAGIFLDGDEVPPPGYRIVQPDLANTLEAIAAQGREGFYGRGVAQRLVAGVRAGGGIWTADDLASYRVAEREPVRGAYRGWQISSASPPSSGGVALLTMLNILSGFTLDELDPASRDHVIIEAMRRAYRDRAVYLGDPDFTDVPVRLLTNPWYGAGLRSTIRLDRATRSTDLQSDAGAGRHTTHFSILDTEGNRVAATLSINYPFGSGFVPRGTGVLLNDEMDDFSVKPGVPNGYGLVGGAANAVEAGKRPLSSMTPTFVESEDGVAILGTPGGSRIISMLLLASLQIAAGELDPAAWVSRPRYHHQYLPDEVQYEPGAFSPAVQIALLELGHQLQPLAYTYGNMQAVFWDRAGGRVRAASDPRGNGEALVREPAAGALAAQTLMLAGDADSRCGACDTGPLREYIPVRSTTASLLSPVLCFAGAAPPSRSACAAAGLEAGRDAQCWQCGQ
jgi:gamma-glutamyltranspeptidase/glutathione hydrolase